MHDLFDSHDWLLDRIENELIHIAPIVKYGFFTSEFHIPADKNWEATVDVIPVSDTTQSKYEIPETSRGTARNITQLVEYYEMGDVVGVTEQNGALVPVDG